MNYEVGKFYTFDFKEKYVGKDGNIYLRLIDPNAPEVFISVKPYSYQQDWEDITQKLECFCYKQDIYGKYRFAQSLWSALNYMYGPYLGHYNEFVIEERVETEKEGANCCRISDVYGFSQLYYPDDNSFWDKNHVGDSIILYVKGIHPSQEGKNNAFLELVPRVEERQPTQDSDAEQAEVFIRDESRVSIGAEDDHNEFKSSIAFPAGGTEEDMAAQLAVIMKSVAGFMNKDGGTLYIGVNDSGEPYKDIKEEFQYLNDDETDNNTYHANQDHYKLKLNNKIRHDLGGYASSLASVTFRKANGVTYAAIEAKKSDSVVWYQNTELYVRCDNSTRRMFGDSITKFILSRVNINRFNDIVNQPVPESEDKSTTEVVTKPQGKVAQKTLVSQTGVMQNEPAWRYVSLFKDGTWSFRKIPYDRREELITEVPIPQKPKSYVMMVAYASGKINAVNLKDLLYGTGRNQNTLIGCDTRKKQGITVSDDSVVNAFCIKKGGLILMESLVGEKTRIKAHQMEVVSTHNQLSAQGNKMQPEGTLVRIAPVEAGTAEMDSIIAMGILVKGHERYSKNGVNKAKLQGKYQELIDKILG